MTQLGEHHDDGSAASKASAWADHSYLAFRDRYADFKMLTKPGITVMVVVTTLVGFVAGVRDVGGSMVALWATLFCTLLGAALSCMGASALNQFIEVDTDARMPRTQDRPLPAGRMSPTAAMLIGLTLSAMGVFILAAGATSTAAAVSMATIIGYALVYTPMKRLTPLSTVVGALPGAAPPLIGYAAVTGNIGAAALVMFAIMFIWQMPHFFAIAWLYRKDYGQAGIKVLPVTEPDCKSTYRQTLFTALLLLPVGVLPTFLGQAGWFYFAGALLAGLAFVATAWRFVQQKDARSARICFFASLFYLPLVLALIVIDAA